MQGISISEIDHNKGKALLFHQDSVQSLNKRIKKEWYYKKQLTELGEEEIERLSELYNRNLTIQWSQRSLLPPSKPLFDIKCLDYTTNSYNVSVSIVITYYNELAILLMRLLTTIKHRTPLKYLKEIVLIDDKSVMNITGEIIEYAREQDIPIVYLHNQKRIGLGNSRRKGIYVSTGDIIVVVDSHMEVNNGWLEPLLHVLKTKPRALAIPLIHLSNERYYAEHNSFLINPYYVKMEKGFGIFNVVENSEGSGTGRRWESFPSSGMLGGGLAGYKSVLEEFYPEGVTGNEWGVENNRLALRAWMCGEGLWMCPCSQILHPNGLDDNVGRFFHDPKANTYKLLMGESVSEVINFIQKDEDKHKIVLKFTNDRYFADIIKKHSIQIKSKFDPEEHNCRDYSYYTKEVIEYYVSWENDEFFSVGEIQSVSIPRLCLEAIDKKIVPYTCRNGPIGVNDGHTMGLTNNYNIRIGDAENLCWDAPSSQSEDQIGVIVYLCHSKTATGGEPFVTQHFNYKKESKHIVHVPTNRCLEIVNWNTTWLVKCNYENKGQEWNIKSSAWF